MAPHNLALQLVTHILYSHDTVLFVFPNMGIHRQTKEISMMLRLLLLLWQNVPCHHHNLFVVVVRPVRDTGAALSECKTIIIYLS